MVDFQWGGQGNLFPAAGDLRDENTRGSSYNENEYVAVCSAIIDYTTTKELVTMHSRLHSAHKAPGRLFRHTCLLLTALAVSFAGISHAADADDKEVRAFFRSVEDSFRNKDVPQIVGHVHKDLFYIMTYSTNEDFSYLVSDFEKYRINVGSFFKSKPDIREYSISVDDIQRSGDDIMVVARVKSVVQLNGIINSCDASSNYLLQKIQGEYLIRDVRGDATCTNTKAN